MECACLLLRRKSVVLCTERHDAIFVVGGLDETVMLRGMRYHPTDIENSIVRCHRKICEWQVTFYILFYLFLLFCIFYFLFLIDDNPLKIKSQFTASTTISSPLYQIVNISTHLSSSVIRVLIFQRFGPALNPSIGK